MGFNNHGAGELAIQLARQSPEVPIGVNIGKTKTTPAESAVEDYAESARLLGPLASFMVVNVSSPNTPGLRNLQAVESLRPILAAVQAETTTPVLVKISPDLTDEEIDEIADLAVELGLAGIVATNTTVSRAGLKTPGSTSWVRAVSPEHPRAAVRGGAAAAVPACGRPAGAHQRRRHRNRRGCLGPYRFGRITAAGLHRLHLRRRVVGQAHSRRPG